MNSKKIGIVILFIGIIGTIIFGIKAVQASENFSVMGVDVAVSSADWTPVIISVILLFAGLVMVYMGKK